MSHLSERSYGETAGTSCCNLRMKILLGIQTRHGEVSEGTADTSPHIQPLQSVGARASLTHKGKQKDVEKPPIFWQLFD